MLGAVPGQQPVGGGGGAARAAGAVAAGAGAGGGARPGRPPVPALPARPGPFLLGCCMHLSVHGVWSFRKIRCAHRLCAGARMTPQELRKLSHAVLAGKHGLNSLSPISDHAALAVFLWDEWQNDPHAALQMLSGSGKTSRLLCQALEQAGDHPGARDAFEHALTLGADPNPMADPTPPAAAGPPGAGAAGGPARPASGFEQYETLGFLTPEETAGAVGGLARAALRLGDLELGLRAAAAAADAAVSLECASILERQGRLEVTCFTPLCTACMQ